MSADLSLRWVQRKATSTDITNSNEVGWSIQHGDVDGAVIALKAAANHTHEQRVAIRLRAQRASMILGNRENLLDEFLYAVDCKPVNT